MFNVCLIRPAYFVMLNILNLFFIFSKERLQAHILLFKIL